MTNLRIAARSLARNRRRAMIALTTIVVAVIAMVLADGFAQWIFWAMREGTIQSQLGHIQVVRPGYYEQGAADPFSYLLPERSPIFTELAHRPGVKVVAPRLSVSGLASHGDATVGFIGEGIDPASESELSKAFRIVSGHNLSTRKAKEVVIGRGLARNLGVQPGDTVALLANTRRGGINAVEATVAGIFISANQAYDDSAMRLPIELAQALLKVQGATAWLVLLDDTEATDQTLGELRTRYSNANPKVQFVPWYERADFYNKTVALFSKQIDVLRAIIAAIIVLSISNMLVMNVLERTGEIGTLLALGFKRRTLLKQFATEGVLLGLVGGVAGVLAGAALAHLISAIGIPMPPPPGMEEGYTGAIRATAPVFASAFAVACGTTIAAGLYPAWKASRLPIVDSLRHNI